MLKDLEHLIWNKMRYLEFGRAENTSPQHGLAGADGVTVADHLLEMSPQVLQYHSRTLTCIEFYGATLLSNVETTLMNCPNMKELTFTYIVMDEYRPYWHRRDDVDPVTFSAPRLQVLELNNSPGKLTKDENLLLDFLFHSVDMPALRNFTVGRMTYGYSTKHLANEVMNKYGYNPGSGTLAKIMVKCSQSLKSLAIRRHKFAFIEDADGEVLQGLGALRIQKLRFQCDTSGMHHLLRAISGLEKLDCYSHFELTQLEISEFAKLQSALADCAARNSASLKHFQGIGIIGFPLETFSKALAHLESCTKFDLGAFRNCGKLRQLTLDRLENYTGDDSKVYHYGFTIVNSQYLPECLMEIELWLGHIDAAELHSLTARMRELVNLHSFQLTCVACYTITEHCFMNIVSITDSWLQAHFHNGIFPDNFYPQRILLELENEYAERIWEVRMAENCCEFISRERRDRF